MRRMIGIVFLMLAALLLAGFARQTKEFVWQNIQSDVQVQADGRLSVTETLTLRYTGGPFTFAFRDLPNRRLDRIESISVRDQEGSYQQVDDSDSSVPYTFSIESTRSGQRVRWVYPETVGGTRSFTLRYEVVGAVRRAANADEVWWAVVFADRSEVVEQAQGTITLPAAVPADQLRASAPDVPGAVELAVGRATVRASDIAPGQELTLRLQFPPSVVGGATPAWQATAAAQEQYNATFRPAVNVGLSALTALLAVALGLLTWRWWQRNRDPQPRGFVADALPDPPDDLPPAMAATLIGARDWEALLATIIDLAERGFIELHETLGGWRGRTRQLVLRRTTQSTADLRPFEADALRAVFDGQPDIILQERAREIAQAARPLAGDYRAALVERGYLAPERQAIRRRGVIIGMALLICGALVFVPAIMLAEQISWWLPVVAGVLALMGLVWAVVALTTRGLTQSGADARARWQAFRRYLRRITPDMAPGGQFHYLLPYAVGLGEMQRLTHAYSQTREPLPGWYYPVIFGHTSSAGRAGAGTVGNTLLLQDFGQNFVSAMSSASSAGSAGGAAGAGGGGASGGGGGGAG